MVRLNRIYTRGGDAGETSLGDGSRVVKTDSRVRAMGAVDELNCVIGVAIQQGLSSPAADLLRRVQNELFDLGADLSCPFTDDNEARLRITADQVKRLENQIDEINEPLGELTSFVLPGGSPAAAFLHLARSVCRRAEVETIAVGNSVNPRLLEYLNRLSDLLFVMARAANDNGNNDVLWVPGQDRSQD